MEQLIYKYCRDYGLKFLQNGKLKFSAPIQFDDPFELMPQPGDPTLSLEDSNVLLGDDMRMMELYESTGSTTSFAEWIGARRASPEGFRRECAKVMPEAIERFCPGSLANTSKKFGMTCFSEIPSDVRMWSHYADEHKGIVVGLDLNLLGIRLLPVRCQSERVRFTASQWANPRREWALKLLTTKSTDWNYQKEWRAILRLGQSPLTWDDELKADVFQVPREAIKRVLIGSRATGSTVAAVRAVLASSGPRVNPERARPHRSAFAMEFEAVETVAQP